MRQKREFSHLEPGRSQEKKSRQRRLNRGSVRYVIKTPALLWTVKGMSRSRVRLKDVGAKGRWVRNVKSAARICQLD